jgi:DNA gyrase subunit A
VFISQNGMVQRTDAGGISLMGRSTQGVRVMNLKDGDRVSAVALVVESTSTNGDADGGSPEPPEGNGEEAPPELAEAEQLAEAEPAPSKPRGSRRPGKPRG